MAKELAIVNYCIGDAHKPNVDMDHCGVCIPWWRKYPTCPNCKWKLLQSGYCRCCHKYYDMKDFRNAN